MEQRRRLFGLATIDAIILIVTYNLLFYKATERWAGVTGGVASLVGLWLIISYLLGRYSYQTATRQAWSIVKTAALLTAITISMTWISSREDIRTLPSFLLPLFAISGTLSAIAAIKMEDVSEARNHWILATKKGNEAGLQADLKRDNWCRVKLEIVSCPFRLEERLDKVGKAAGIAIDEGITLREDLASKLLEGRKNGLEIVKLIDWYERFQQRVSPELLTNEWLLFAEGFKLRPGTFRWRMKRLGDLALSSALIIATSPIVLMSALAVKLEDGGPVLYSQIRTGLAEKKFRIWKLRTMKVDSEHGKPLWSSSDDIRITRVGRILRNTRIDELPQLWNVFSGDMSLIGPRPERPELESSLESAIPHYRVRHWVRPGLSGWAQVCYRYGASVEDTRIKLSYDIYYLRNYTLWLDILILIKTVRLVSRAEGAIAK